MANQNLETVTLDPLQGGGPGHNWKVTHGTQSGSDPNTYPKVHLPNGGGPYLIVFEIKGNNSITFSNDPIWVQAGSKPQTKTLDGQIVAVAASADGKQLFVLDKNNNSNQGLELYYRLNFNGYGYVDPIINNGGGTTPAATSSFETAILLITAASFATLLFVAFQQSLIKRIVTGIQRWTSKS